MSDDALGRAEVDLASVPMDYPHEYKLHLTNKKHQGVVNLSMWITNSLSTSDAVAGSAVAPRTSSPPFTIHHSPFTIHHSPFVIVVVAYVSVPQSTLNNLVLATHLQQVLDMRAHTLEPILRPMAPLLATHLQQALDMRAHTLEPILQRMAPPLATLLPLPLRTALPLVIRLRLIRRLSPIPPPPRTARPILRREATRHRSTAPHLRRRMPATRRLVLALLPHVYRHREAAIPNRAGIRHRSSCSGGVVSPLQQSPAALLRTTLTATRSIATPCDHE